MAAAAGWLAAWLALKRRDEGALLLVVSKNTNELKTRTPGCFGFEVSRLGSPMEARILGHEDSEPRGRQLRSSLGGPWLRLNSRAR